MEKIKEMVRNMTKTIHIQNTDYSIQNMQLRVSQRTKCRVEDAYSTIINL